MHVGVDVDGVLRRLIHSIRREFLNDYPQLESRIISSGELKYWDIRKLAPNDESTLGQVIEKYSLHRPKSAYKCFRNAETYENSISAMRRLYHDAQHNDHTVSICSSQGTPWQRKATTEWLNEHEVPCDATILTGDGKGHFGIDLMFDDRVKNCRAVEQNGGVGVLKSMKYNRSAWESGVEASHRVDSLDAFRKIMLDLS